MSEEPKDEPKIELPVRTQADFDRIFRPESARPTNVATLLKTREGDL
jgi:hypothetical protein